MDFRRNRLGSGLGNQKRLDRAVPVFRRDSSVRCAGGSIWSLPMTRHRRQRSQPRRYRHAWRLVIHGGAGMMARDSLSAERCSNCAALDRARGRSRSSMPAAAMLDAVEAAAGARGRPHFGAGRGWSSPSGHDRDGRGDRGAERPGYAGAVTGVTATRNPISLARAGWSVPHRPPELRGRRRPRATRISTRRPRLFHRRAAAAA